MKRNAGCWSSKHYDVPAIAALVQGTIGRVVSVVDGFAVIGTILP